MPTQRRNRQRKNRRNSQIRNRKNLQIGGGLLDWIKGKMSNGSGSNTGDDDPVVHSQNDITKHEPVNPVVDPVKTVVDPVNPVVDPVNPVVNPNEINKEDDVRNSSFSGGKQKKSNKKKKKVQQKALKQK